MTPEELLHTGRKLLERSGVAYGDMRHVRIRRERLRMRNGILDPAFRDLDAGFGIRVLHRGAWGFAASNRMTGADLEQTVAAAVAVAEASARTRRNPVRLAPAEPARGRYRTPFRIDGFEVPLEDKVRLLREPVEAMQGIDGVLTAEAGLSLTREQKRFVSTEGADLEQDILHTGAGIAATARVGDEVQKRSFPNSFGGNVAAGGYEIATGAGLLENAVRVAEEARALCRAPDCPSRNTTLVVGADQMALQVHESCGHPTELDRVLGTEISLAGGSFMDLKGLGSLRYGSSLVNLTADATTPGGLGTFGWDDEGVPARRTPLVEEGVHVGFLSSRETAAEVGLPRSGGTMRAESWRHLPLIRMVNVNLEPGEGSLEEILSEVREGIYITTNKSWSIDDLRLNFQFGCEAAWEIRDGKLGQIYKNPVYTGSTPEFWGSCSAVGGREDWMLTGITTCGKGDPMQGMHVGHGSPPARFEGVEVGVSR